MNLQQYILIFFLGTVVSAIAWLLIVFNIDPIATGAIAHVFFYVSLAITLAGFFTTLFTVVRSIVFHRNIEAAVFTSLRQAVLFTILVIGTMIMLSAGILTWWLIVLFVAAITFVELFFVGTNTV